MNFLFSVVLLGTFSFADLLPQKIETSRAIMPGVRYVNAAGEANTGKRLLIPHGLSANFHEFRILMEILGAEGYDAWAFNFPGHGNGSERAIVKNYAEGDYRFEKYVSEDFPAMLDRVSEGGKYKVVILGHSMGGMVPRAAVIDKTVNVKHIESMVLLGSPAHFQTPKSIGDLLGANYFAERALFSGSGAEPFDVAQTFIKNDLTNAAMLWPFPIFWLAKGVEIPFKLMEMRGIVEIANFGREDRGPRAMTDGPPKDIFRSFAEFRDKGYPFRDREVGVPILHIAGSLDGLAPWRDIHESAKLQSRNAGYWFIKMNDVSHVDLVASKVVATYREPLLKFLRAPHLLGNPNQTFLELKPPCWGTIGL